MDALNALRAAHRSGGIIKAEDGTEVAEEEEQQQTTVTTGTDEAQSHKNPNEPPQEKEEPGETGGDTPGVIVEKKQVTNGTPNPLEDWGSRVRGVDLRPLAAIDSARAAYFNNERNAKLRRQEIPSYLQPIDYYKPVTQNTLTGSIARNNVQTTLSGLSGNRGALSSDISRNQGLQMEGTREANRVLNDAAVQQKQYYDASLRESVNQQISNAVARNQFANTNADRASAYWNKRLTTEVEKNNADLENYRGALAATTAYLNEDINFENEKQSKLAALRCAAPLKKKYEEADHNFEVAYAQDPEQKMPTTKDLAALRAEAARRYQEAYNECLINAQRNNSLVYGKWNNFNQYTEGYKTQSSIGKDKTKPAANTSTGTSTAPATANTSTETAARQARGGRVTTKTKTTDKSAEYQEKYYNRIQKAYADFMRNSQKGFLAAQRAQLEMEKKYTDIMYRKK
jgi:hypothetical protein